MRGAVTLGRLVRREEDHHIRKSPQVHQNHLVSTGLDRIPTRYIGSVRHRTIHCLFNPVHITLSGNLRQHIVRTKQLWVAEITYVRLNREFLHRAVALDKFSRRVVGWGLQRAFDPAFQSAFETQEPEAAEE